MPIRNRSRRVAGVLTAMVLVTAGLVLTPTVAVAAPDTPTEATSDAPSGLTVNGLGSAVDIDEAPRFGWHVNTARQTAYEIRVAEAPGDPTTGAIWSSGKVGSAQQNDIAYQGPELAVAGRYTWTVRTWDSTDEPTTWAATAEFGTGPGSAWGDSSAIWGRGGDNWTDYRLSGTFEIIQNAATIVYRAGSVENNYFFQFRSDTNILKPHRAQAGQAPVVIHNQEIDLSELDIVLENDRAYDFVIEGEGSRITIWLEGTQVYERTDFGAYLGGGFGFRTGNFEQARFDDIEVVDLHGAVLYENDFSGPNLDFPTMNHVDGKLVVPNARNDIYGGTWANYTLETSLTIDEVALGIRFRAVDGNNNYFWQFRGADNRLVPHRTLNGSAATLGAAVNLPAGTLTIGQAVDVRIEAHGPRIRTFIDDVQVDERIDRTFSRGGVGVRNGMTETGRLHDLLVVSSRGDTLIDTSFEDGSRVLPCGVVEDGSLVVPKSAVCVNVGMRSDWSFLRKDFTLPDKEIAWASMYATGSDAKPAKQHVYKLYLNGEFTLMGPTRPMAGEHRYDGTEVAHLLRPGADNTIAATTYTTTDQRFQAELHIAYTDGTREVLGTDGTWQTLNGDETFPWVGSIGTSYYQAPKENLDARTFPEGFAEPGYTATGWAPAVVKPALTNLRAAPMDKVQEQYHEPQRIVEKAPGHYFIDFGRTWVGGLRYDVAAGQAGSTIDVRFGETTVDGDSTTVRYNLHAGNSYQDVYTQRAGSQRFETFGMRVFRYVEVIGAPEEITAESLKALALVYPFDRDAATFASSSDNLDAVWNLSRNSIEALNVNFYVDTWTRERINYEADAYLQLMSTLYLMDDLSLGIYSMDYFKTNRTWPTEWPLYVILAVHDAWRQTGQTQQLFDYYDNLKTKLPEQWFEESTGLIRKTSRSDGCNSQTDCDIVDWPASQRDGYQFRQYNTVINALSFRTYRDMAAIATEIGEAADAAHFTDRADTIRAAMNDRLYNGSTGRYHDGMDAAGVLTQNHSLHASAFPLAFGVPESTESQRVADYVASRGMACSVYCAPFVKNGLFAAGNGQAALELLTSEGTWSWMNMINLGAGATMESWDPSMKANLTFSHPWAASPAFTVPSGVFGIQPTAPGYATFEVKPQPGDLDHGTVTVPSVRGPIGAAFTRGTDDVIRVGVQVPGNTEAAVSVPVPEDTEVVYVNLVAHEVEAVDGYATIEGLERGCYVISAESSAAVLDDERLTGVCEEEPVVGQGPTVEAEVSNAGLDGWHGAGTTVTLTTAEGATIAYRLGEDDWVGYDGPFTLPEGESTVEHRATASNGLTGPVGSLSVKVDATAPEVGAQIDEQRQVTITVADEGGSGVSVVEYSLDDGEWVIYTEPFTVDSSPQTVTYRATDRGGNTSEVGTLEVAQAPGPGPKDAPVATVPPSVSGQAVVGRVLRATPGGTCRVWCTASSGCGTGRRWQVGPIAPTGCGLRTSAAGSVCR
ncbi:family 78 glycoside hydrolase catalytic domain [Nocardioides sp.]|uniref:family 78 glycoside hydrolase catalytic domain n=1 Tax=Nocardioides sp. TaxID=35761 RepID=UPI002735D41F|nr:family 78 glycoside hydrolase catalytic domain [Nocardioides sp.]MDP3889821.1 family 78 glycoside hydrolase catalytic domain [Nocardioides sp.]